MRRVLEVVAYVVRVMIQSNPLSFSICSTISLGLAAINSTTAVQSFALSVKSPSRLARNAAIASLSAWEGFTRESSCLVYIRNPSKSCLAMSAVRHAISHLPKDV
jgi:hypothetical protein